MHGQSETSMTPRLALFAAHLLLLLAAGWLYTDTGSHTAAAWLGGDSPGDVYRRGVLGLFGAVFFGRLTLTGLYLLRRRFGWDEFAPVLLATAIYQIGFALLGTTQTKPLGIADTLGIGLYALGCTLNTASEWQRRRFKANPDNAGRLYTQGLFRWVRHVNYLGDILWVAGWAVLTANPGSAIIPLLLAAGSSSTSSPPSRATSSRATAKPTPNGPNTPGPSSHSSIDPTPIMYLSP